MVGMALGGTVTGDALIDPVVPTCRTTDLSFRYLLWPSRYVRWRLTILADSLGRVGQRFFTKCLPLFWHPLSSDGRAAMRWRYYAKSHIYLSTDGPRYQCWYYHRSPKSPVSSDCDNAPQMSKLRNATSISNQAWIPRPVVILALHETCSDR